MKYWYWSYHAKFESSDIQKMVVMDSLVCDIGPVLVSIAVLISVVVLVSVVIFFLSTSFILDKNTIVV